MNNFLQSGFTFTKDESELKLKYQLFNSLLTFNIIVVFLASIIRFTEGKMTNVVIDLIYCTFAIVIILLARKYRDSFDLLIKLLMIMSLFVVSAIFYLNANSMIGISWFIVQLMVVFFLTSRTFSYIMFFLIIIVIGTTGYLNQDNGCTCKDTILAMIPLFVSFVFIQFYEKRNALSKMLLKEQNEKLEENALRLEALTNNLQVLVDIEVENNRNKDNLLAKQSKTAALGIMIDAIAHQWKQPLSVIQVNMQSLLLGKYNDTVVTNDTIEDVNNKVEKQINHLVSTIDEFRSFFRTNKEQTSTNVKSIIDSVCTLMKDTISSNNIKIDITGDKNIEVMCIPNEFKHVFINLINNTIDAFNEHTVDDRNITFNISEDENNTILRISDNAGGIPSDIIANIFTPNFTTKEVGKGTGIGLFLSKQIIEKFNASINVENIKEVNSDNFSGACFIITIKK